MPSIAVPEVLKVTIVSSFEDLDDLTINVIILILVESSSINDKDDSNVICWYIVDLTPPPQAVSKENIINKSMIL